MAKNRRDVRVVVGHEDEELDRGFKKSTVTVQKFVKDTSRSFTSLDILTTASFAGITAVVSGGLLKMAFDAATLQDEVGKLALRLGSSVEALSRLQIVAELSGVAFNQFAIGLQRQTRRISEAAKGTGVARAALRELNLEVQVLKDLAPEQQFEIIAERLKKVENATDQVRLAQQLWDSEGVKLLQIAKSNVTEMKRLADATGLVFTEEDSKRAADFNDKVLIFKRSIQAVSQLIGGALIPTLSTTLDGAKDFIDLFRDLTPLEAGRKRIDLLKDSIKALLEPTTAQKFLQSIIKPLKSLNDLEAELSIALAKQGVLEEQSNVITLGIVRVSDAAAEAAENFRKFQFEVSQFKEFDIGTAKTIDEFDKLAAKALTITDVFTAQEKANALTVGKNIQLSAFQASEIVKNNTLTALSEEAKTKAMTVASRGLQTQILNLVETNKFGARALGDAFVQEAKAFIAGKAAQAAVAAVFETALGFATIGTFASAGHFAAASNFAIVAGGGLAATFLAQGLSGGSDLPGGPAERKRDDEREKERIRNERVKELTEENDRKLEEKEERIRILEKRISERDLTPEQTREVREFEEEEELSELKRTKPAQFKASVAKTAVLAPSVTNIFNIEGVIADGTIDSFLQDMLIPSSKRLSDRNVSINLEAVT